MGHCLRFVVTSRALSSVGDIHVVWATRGYVMGLLGAMLLGLCYKAIGTVRVYVIRSGTGHYGVGHYGVTFLKGWTL